MEPNPTTIFYIGGNQTPIGIKMGILTFSLQNQIYLKFQYLIGL